MKVFSQHRRTVISVAFDRTARTGAPRRTRTRLLLQKSAGAIIHGTMEREKT